MRNFLSFSSCSLPVLCLWLLTYCLLICRTAASVSYAAQVQPLDGPVAQRGAKCLSDLQSGAIVPSSAGPNKGIVINVEGCYDHSSLGLEDAMVFFPLAEEGKLFFPPLDYNATWLQPNYFPSFGVGNETDYVLPGSSSSSAASTASDGSGSSSTGGGTSGRAYSAELLSMFAAGQSTSSHHLLSTLNVLQDLCAAQCQQALFYPAPTGDVNPSSSSNTSTGAPKAAQSITSNGVFSFRFVIAYGNCYCLNETASALAYAHLNLATSLPCCLAAPSWALANNRSNISTMFPQSSAPRCSSSKLYGVMYTADLACPTNVSRCGGVDGGGSSSPCRMEEGCCVQYLAAPSPPIAMASNVTLYIMALLFTVIALQVFWWTFKWYVLRRHRRLARGDDEVNDLQLLLMRQALHGWQQRQQPPLALSRTKDEAVDAASEAMSLLEVAVGESIPPEDCCPMCLEELSTQECVRVLCGHIIHTSCMKEFLAHKLRSYFCPVTCPMCRATVLVQQPVDESPPLGARASPVGGGGAYMPPLVLPNGEGEVANGVAVVEQLPPRRRRRFRHLNDEEIARANLIISRLLHRHEQLQDHLVAVRLRDDDDDDGDVEDARAMQVADRGGGGAGRQAHLEQIRREIAAEDDEVTHQGTSNAVAPDAATAAGRIGDIERQDVERWLTHRSSPLGPATQGGGELRPLPSPSGEVQQNLGRDPLADSISSLHAHPSRDGQPRLGDTSNIDNSANQRRDDGDGAEGGNRPSSSVEHAMSDAARRIMQDL